MPLSGGTSGAHDDSMHQGNAKRGATGGLAGLSAYKEVEGFYGCKLYRDVGDQIYILDSKSSEKLLIATRMGASSWEVGILESVGVVDRLQTASMKDVANGIAELDATGSLLLPGSKMYYTRDGSDDVHIYERTSNEEAYAFHRVGADDYTFFVKESNVWKRMQTESMKDAANGIAGLDASVKLLWDQLPLPMLTVVQFQANVGTGTAEEPQKINDTSVAASVMFDVVGEYAQVLFPHPMWIKEYRHHGTSGLAGDGRWKIQIYHDGAWVDNTVAIPLRNLESWSDWVVLTIPAYTQGIRFVATTIDSTFGISSVRELEIRG